MDRLLLGDNQFFGINHMSEERARSQAMRFPDAASIVKALEQAYEAGIRTFMCTTHDQLQTVCDHFRSNSARFPGWKFYPCLPYAHKYADAVTELGYAGALKKLVSGNMVSALLRGAWAALRKDFMGALDLLVDTELRPFKGVSYPVVFLNNIATDMMLGLGAGGALARFASRVRQHHDAEAGFITMNLPRLVHVLQECGIKDAIVCSPVNRIGFRMNPDRQSCERTMETMPYRGVAMSVFASGGISVKEAIEYVCRFRSICSVVFGASTRVHIAETARAMETVGRG